MDTGNNIPYLLTASIRSRLYGLFGLVFRSRPSNQLLENLKQSDVLNALESFPGISDQVKQLRSLILNNSVNELCVMLGVAYTRLFVIPGTRIVPYESAYSGGLLMGEPVVKVMKYYSQTGFSVPDDELPDHIWVEFQFLQYLTESQNNREEAAGLLEMEHEFLNSHVLNWAPEFLDQVQASQDVFYSTMAALTGQFLELIAQDFGELDIKSK